MPDLRQLLFTPALPAAPAQRAYAPGITPEGAIETPQTVFLKTLIDQLASRTYENLIRPMSSAAGAGMAALTAAAPGAAVPLNKALAAFMVPQMAVQGAKAVGKGDYAEGTMALALALPVVAGAGMRVKGGIHKAPVGSKVTRPAPTYDAGVAAVGNTAQNIWIRQAEGATNADRTLLVQFSNDLINPQGSGPKSRADAYYDKLYQSRSGYDRPADFWEIPQWQANIAHSLPKADVYVVRNPTEAVEFANAAGYKNVAFSALDVNKGMIADFAKGYKGDIVVGGYGDLKTAFKDLPNVTVHPTVQSFVESEGGTYKPGYDYRHYHGTKTIPRLTMSDGCLHQCAFCTIPKKVVERSKAEIMQQAEAFAKDLPSSLVYLNDKTFGQAKNHTLLPEVNAVLRKSNPDFQGFVIQTTAAQMKRMDPQFLKDAGIKYAELGIETYNDPILRSLKKPASEKIIDSAADKLREAGVTMVPNIMVGLPGETPESYARTMNWLRSNSDNISHANIYNLAVYEEAPISKTLKTVTEADKNENIIAKSWMDDPAAHTAFNDEIMDWASGQLDKTPRPRKADFQTIGGGVGMPQELKTGPQLEELLNPPVAKPEPMPYKSRLNIGKLGRVVEPEDLRYGFILPDGRAVAIHGAATEGPQFHGPRFSEAVGEKYSAGKWKQTANAENAIRITGTSIGPGAELFNHPTDAQLSALRRLEKAQGSLQFELVDPFFLSNDPYPATMIGTGTGVNQIRRTIEGSNYNPAPFKLTTPKPKPPTIGDLLMPPVETPQMQMQMPSLGSLLQGGLSA